MTIKVFSVVTDMEEDVSITNHINHNINLPRHVFPVLQSQAVEAMEVYLSQTYTVHTDFSFLACNIRQVTL